jgi:hypothetical protein
LGLVTGGISVIVTAGINNEMTRRNRGRTKGSKEESK